MKQIHLAWAAPGTSPEAFAREARERWAPRLAALPLDGIKLSFSDPRPPRVTIFPLDRTPICVWSLWSRAGDFSGVAEALAGLGDRRASYVVDEALPVTYARAWPDGEVSPGAALLTLFHPRSGLDHGRFVDIWHGEHTPMALAIHPLWSYVRNEVLETLEGEPFGGIVEEHARSRRDLTRPWRFFGGPLRALPNMVRVALHSSTFLDLGRVKNHLVRELWIRTPRMPTERPPRP